ERRLVARLAPFALDGVEQRRLLAADVRAGTAAQVDVEPESLAHDVVAQEPAPTALVDRGPQPLVRQRVLAPDVEEAGLAAGRITGDGQRLDDGEGVALHHHTVFERAGLGLVGVAHEVVWADRLL